MKQGLVTSGEGIGNKRAIPTLAIIQGVAAIGGMMIKGINALVDAKRASLFNNAIKLINENVQITHDRLIMLENRTAMMAKAIITVLKDFKQQINNTNDRLNRQYPMMTKAHDRYNRLFRQTHKTFQIHHLVLLMVKDYITILVGMLQRIHRQYVRYESALDDTLIGIEHLNSGYLTHCILDPKILAQYLEAVEDDLEETAPAFELVFTNVYQYYGNSLISFTNIIDDLLLQLLILIKLKVYMGLEFQIQEDKVCYTPLKDKCDAIRNLESPKTLRQTRAFCGMVNFLSSFLPNLHRLLILIYDLQKKAKKFKWTEEAEKAFNDIKKLLINPPVLKAPTPDSLF